MNEKLIELEKEAKEYQRYCDTIYSLIAVYELSSDSKITNSKASVAIDLLLKNILTNIEEYQFDIPLSGKTFADLMDLISEKDHKLFDKYRDYLPFKVIDDYLRYGDRMLVEIHNISQPLSKTEFDFVKMFATYNSYNPQWIKSFLAANISFETKYKMFAELVKISETGIEYNLEHPCYIHVNKEKAEKIRQELLDRLKDDTKTKEEIFDYLLDNQKYDHIMRIQKYIDLSGLQHHLNSIPLVMFLNTDSKEDSIDYLVTMLKGEEYRKRSDYDKALDIIYLLCDIKLRFLDAWDVAKVLKATDIKIDSDLMYALTRRLYKEYKKSVEQDWIDYRVVDYHCIEDAIKEIADIIVRKASNKKEYKLYKKYADTFLKNTIPMYYENTMQAKKNKESLRDKRKELSTLLYNLNDKLQEEYPGKRLIKEINFKED